MAIQLLILIIVFWLPVALVAIVNILWDIKFWQASGYKADRLEHHISWDLLSTHRKQYKTILKLVLFLALSGVLIRIPLEIPLLAVLFSFTIWSSEAFVYLEKLFAKKGPSLHWEFRAKSLVVVTIFVMSLLPLSIAAAIFGPSGIAPIGNGVSGVTGEIIVGGISIIPSIYIYLVFSAMLGLVYDLGSSLFTSIAVFVTSPFAKLANLIKYNAAVSKLRASNNLLVILISGTYGKTITKQLLQQMLQEEYKVLATPITSTSKLDIVRIILKQLKPSTQVLITDVNAYKQGEISQVSSMLRPHLVVVTGIDQDHIGLFGSVEQTLLAKSESLDYLRAGGTAVLNVDDPLVAELAMRNKSKEILYSTNPSPANLDTTQNKLEVDHYVINTYSPKDSDPDSMSLSLSLKSREILFTIPKPAKEFVHSITAAIAVAVEIGISHERISEVLEGYNFANPEIERLKGDNDTELLISSKSDNIRHFKYSLEQLALKPEGSRILVTSGIKGLGKHKRKIYSTLLDIIANSADVVISYDKDLISMLQKQFPQNADAYVAVLYADEMLYQLRNRLEAQDTTLVWGDIDRHLVELARAT